MRRLILFLALPALAACAGDPLSLQRASAAAIGGATPESVLISNVERSGGLTQWQATVPGGTYRCAARADAGADCAKQ